MNSINVEEIMEKIRTEIKEKGYKESDLSFLDIPISTFPEASQESFDLDKLREKLQRVNETYGVDYYKVIEGGGIKTFIKKAIRKILKFLLYPLCQNQELFNAFSVQTMNQLFLYIQLQEERINELEDLQKKEEG
ncbi:MAG: hypothetical protein NC293_00475 [Roseburia sp.]|nr:hypothetical protein [Roseburia sp.]